MVFRFFFQKIGKMLKTSMSYYEKSSVVTYPFCFINRQSIHKPNCMQRIKNILMRELFHAIALKQSNTERLKYCTIRHTLSNKQTKVIFYSRNNVLYPLLPLFSCRLSYMVFKILQFRIEFLFLNDWVLTLLNVFF